MTKAEPVCMSHRINTKGMYGLAQTTISPHEVYNAEGFYRLMLILAPAVDGRLPRHRREYVKVFRGTHPTLGQIETKRLGNDWFMTGAAILRWLGRMEPGFCKCCGQRVETVP